MNTCNNHAHPVNVGMSERWVSTLGGAGLLVYGLYRRGLPGSLIALGGAAMLHRGISGRCQLYAALGLDTAREEHRRDVPRSLLGRLTFVEGSIVIRRPIDEIYRFWRDLGHLQIVFPHLHCVDQHDDRTSHWVTDLPGKGEVHWEAVITEEHPSEMIAWKTLEGSDLHHSGRVDFLVAEGGQATEIRVAMRYRPPLGPLGAAAAVALNRSPQLELNRGLQRLKEMIEAGEIVLTGDHPRDGRTAAELAAESPARPKHKADAAVQEASEESFPASDPPSFTPGKA